MGGRAGPGGVAGAQGPFWWEESYSTALGVVCDSVVAKCGSSVLLESLRTTEYH